MASKKIIIPLKDGGAQLHEYLRRYQAKLYRDSSTEKGHVYWVESSQMWILVMRKGDNAHVTFHPWDKCPCKML